MNSFKEFVKTKNEGLQTRLGDRVPDGWGNAANLAANVAADIIPGGGAIKSAGEFLWNIISNRRQRINFGDLSQRATEHKQKLTQAGIDPNKVFQFDDNLAKMLSDEAISIIMQDTLAKLDR